MAQATAAVFVAPEGSELPNGTVVQLLAGAQNSAQLNLADFDYVLRDSLANLSGEVSLNQLLPLATSHTLTNPAGDLGVISETQATVVRSATNAGLYTFVVSGGVGNTFTLTTNIETVPATGVMPAGSTVSGVLAAGVAAGQTFQTGDVINANLTSDVNVTITGDAANVVDINNARSVNFRNLSGAASVGTNAVLWDGVAAVNVNQSNAAVGIANGGLATTYGVSNSIAATADGIAVGIRAGDLAGTTSDLKFAATNAGSVVGAATTRSVLTGNGTGIEQVSVALTGNNLVQVATAGGNGTTDYATLTLTGAGNNDVQLAAANTLAATSTINGSALTGNLLLDVQGGLSTGDTVSAGAGTVDVLRATVNGTVATGLNITGFESFRLDSGANSTLAFAATPNFTDIRIDAGVAGVKTLANVGSFNTLRFVGPGTTATAGAANVFNGVTATGGFAGGADTVAVAFSNGAVTNTSATPYASGALNIAGAENINLTVADNSANTLVTLPSVVSSTLQTFSATGSVNLENGAAGAVVIDTQTANSNSIATVNLGGLTGLGVSQIALGTAGAGNTANILGPVTNVTASTGGTTLTVNQVEGATDVLNFIGGNGVDTLNANAALLYTGNIVANGGASNDVFTIGDGAGAVANGATSTNLTGGAGGDTFDLSNGRTTVNVITDLGLGAAVNPAAGQEILTITGAATGVTATVVANFIDSTAGGAAGDTAVINIASAAANNVFNLNAGVIFNAAGNAGAGGVTVNANAAGSNITGTGAVDVLNGGAGNDIMTGGGGNDVISGGAGTNTYIFAATQALNGSDAITGTAADILNVAAFETVGALVNGASTYTQANGQVVVLGGQAVGAADSAAGAIAALNAAGTVTAGAAGVTNWVVVSDNNSTAIYSAAATATSVEYTNSTLTLVASFDQAFSTAQLLGGTVAI